MNSRFLSIFLLASTLLLGVVLSFQAPLPQSAVVRRLSDTSLGVFGQKKKKTEAQLEAESLYWEGDWVCKDCKKKKFFLGHLLHVICRSQISLLRLCSRWLHLQSGKATTIVTVSLVLCCNQRFLFLTMHVCCLHHFCRPNALACSLKSKGRDSVVLNVPVPVVATPRKWATV